MSAAEPAAIFAALGDPTRLSLIGALAGGEARSIARLAHGSAMTRQAVTKHLRILERAGLVAHRRAGRETLFSARADTLAEARAYLDRVSAQWDDALARLKAFVEEPPPSG